MSGNEILFSPLKGLNRQSTRRSKEPAVNGSRARQNPPTERPASPEKTGQSPVGNEPQQDSGSGSNRTLDRHAANSNPVVNLRKREVILAKVSLCIVLIFLVCHGIRIIPNTFEMVQTYMTVSLKTSLFCQICACFAPSCTAKHHRLTVFFTACSRSH